MKASVPRFPLAPVDFRFRALGSKFLLTKVTGEFCVLSRQDFLKFCTKGEVGVSSRSRRALACAGFLGAQGDEQVNAEKFSALHGHLFQAPSLHIMVLTLRCDHRCVYCQTSSRGPGHNRLDMSPRTARKVIDRIFLSPAPALHIEFQGGEPLLNYRVLVHAIRYAREKNTRAGRKLGFTLVSNFSFLDEKKLAFLVKESCSLCTSLDGPARVHDRQRVAPGCGGGAYANVKHWLGIIGKMHARGEYPYRVNALTTVTALSLPYWKEIVDEYVDSGLSTIHLRPVAPFGIGKGKSWERLRVSADEFLDFYRKSLRYIIALNRKGIPLAERTAMVFLSKILKGVDPGYVDLRSPCGAVFGQLAYNYNGDVYTCDEGRMFSAASGNELFRVGSVFKGSARSLVDNPVTKTLALASCLDNVPLCAECAYAPFCGVCPLYNYASEGDVFSRGVNDRCRIHKGIFDLLFGLLQGSERQVFERWMAPAKEEG